MTTLLGRTIRKGPPVGFDRRSALSQRRNSRLSLMESDGSMEEFMLGDQLPLVRWERESTAPNTSRTD
jgi:hypothetical protein